MNQSLSKFINYSSCLSDKYTITQNKREKQKKGKDVLFDD